MKKILFSTGLLFLTFSMYAQTAAVDDHAGHGHATATEVAKVAPAGKTTADNFTANFEVHDFGKIPQGKPVSYFFEVTNNGTLPTTISNVAASCGCTTPEWDKETAIAPGATAKIKVGYNAQAEGPFTKPVTITYVDGSTKVLNIKGEVWKTPAESAPANAALKDINN